MDATRGSARTCKTDSLASPITSCRSPTVPKQRLHRVYHRMRARGKPAQCDRRRVRPRAGVLPLGSSDSRLMPADSSPAGRPGRRATSGRHARHNYGQHPTGVPRPFLESARRQHETGPWGHQSPHHQTGNADTEPGAPLSRPPTRPSNGRDQPRPLDNGSPYQL
jgi:hypothetical protein